LAGVKNGIKATGKLFNNTMDYETAQNCLLVWRNTLYRLYILCRYVIYVDKWPGGWSG
jgi:hypothetical protein